MQKKRFYDKSKYAFCLSNCIKDGILIKCPKCGGKAILTYNNNISTIKCTECFSITNKTLVSKSTFLQGMCRGCNRWCNIPIHIPNGENYSHYVCKCPHCGKKQVMKLVSKIMYWDLYTSPSPLQGELYLKANYRGNNIWAYNYTHLDYLINYIQADLRQKPFSDTYSTGAGASDNLPKFIKQAKNREGILKVLKRMKDNRKSPL